jgi:hypothetical protein
MRRWLGLAMAAFTIVFVMSDSMNALQNSADDAKWISQLKSAPLSQMEQGLPNKAFATWFGEHTKDAEVKYFVEACDGSANVESLVKGTYSCVTVTAVRGASSESVMRFLVTGDHAAQGSQGQYTCKFVIGQEGPPPGSAMKRPTRVFRKLSEMTALLAAQ